MKKIVSFNLVLLMMLSLIICPFFTQQVEAEETSKYENILIVDGKEYNAKSHEKFDTWSYSYSKKYDCVFVRLYGYDGGSIYCSKELILNIVEDSKIESFNEPAIESKGLINILYCDENKKIACDLKIISHNGNSAVKSDKNIIVDSNCEIMSDNVPSIVSGTNDIGFHGFYNCIKYVGDNAQDAKIGEYENQSYIKIDFNEFTLKLNGNGVKTKDGSDCVSDIYNINNYYGLKLEDYCSLYSFEGKKQLGWAKSLDASNNKKDIILMSDKLFSDDFSDDLELTLYAVWGNSDDVILKLHNLVINGNTEDKIYVIKKGEEFKLPNIKYAGCKLVNWQNKDKTLSYSVGEKITLNYDLELYPNFESKKCIIGGEEIELGLDSRLKKFPEGYIRNTVDKIEVSFLENYSGQSIYLPDDTIINVYSQIKIESKDKSPALTVDGDLYIKMGVQSQLEVVAPTSCTAISCSGDLSTSSSVFVVGDNKDDIKYTDEYNGESYFNADWCNCIFCKKGEVVFPKVPKHSRIDNSVFLGWGLFHGIKYFNDTGIDFPWYKPEQNIVNSENWVSVYPVYKPCDDFAVRLYGNGGINRYKRDFSVWYMSSPSQLEMAVSDFEFSKEGYDLKSWNTEADGTGTNYVLNSYVKKEDCLDKDNIVNLYAIWEESSTTTGGGIDPGNPEESYVPEVNYNNIKPNVNITYDKYGKINIDCKSKNNSEGLNVRLCRREENNIIDNISKNNITNIEFNLDSKATSIKFKLSKKLSSALKSKCFLTINSGLANIIIPKEVFDNNENGLNININKENDNLIKIEKNFDNSIKVKLPKNSNKIVYLINDNERRIIPKSIENAENIEFIIKDKDITIEIVDKNVQFEDNKDKNKWYYDAVQFVGNRDLFTVKENKFEPNEKVVRLELVSILHRLENRPEANECNFKDIKNEDVFSTAVAWASNNNIVKGTLKGFEPNKQITREQLCVMIYNYAKYLGLDINVENIELAFDDNNEVSSWSIDAVKWMVEKELLKGSYNKINPRGNTTNAQLATIVKRFVEMIVNDVK